MTDETQAALGKGSWVADGDMNPASNIAGRLYRTENGSVHRVYSLPLPHKVDAWFYPD